MGTKTISIDVDAYDRLAVVRRDGESISDTIRRVVWDPRPFQAVMEKLAADPLSDEAIEAVEQVIAGRSGVALLDTTARIDLTRPLTHPSRQAAPRRCGD